MSMMMFWAVAALLLAGGLLLLLPALWSPRTVARGQSGGANVAVYRDQLQEAERDLANDLISQERFEQLRAEIQRRVLEDAGRGDAAAAPQRPARRTALVLALGLPLCSVALYLALGQPGALAPLALPQQAAGGPGGASHEVTAEQIQNMVSALAERMKANPDNAEGWVMLGRSYTALGRYADAAAALRQAVRLTPGNADLLADLADVVGMTQDARLKGEPVQLIQQALAADPKHVKALALAGSAAFEVNDFQGARRYWEQLLAQVPADSEIARSVRSSLDEVSARAGGAAAAPAAPAAVAQAAPASAAASVAITGQVGLAPELASRVAAGDTLFIYARAAQGPRMPLAIVRLPAGGWPVRFTLDDSTSMAAGARLSQAASVVVVARVSRSGHAMVQSGDLIGESAPLAPGAPGAAGLKLQIDRVQP